MRRRVGSTSKLRAIKRDGSCLLGLEAFEGVNFDVLDQAEELILGVLVFVLLSADSHADLSGNVSDAIAPNKPVETGVNADVLDR